MSDEARLFGRYLLGSTPPERLLQRYSQAQRTVFPEPPDPVDRALLSFVQRHPWSLAPLDAAAGLLRPRSRLRRKLVVMTAVLETTPELSDRFRPLAPGRVRALAALAWLGLRAGARASVGLALWPFAVRVNSAEPSCD